MLDLLKNKLIVSCQASQEEPLHSSYIMGKMAYAAKCGGAKAIKAAGINDIIQIKKDTDLPIIGIIKRKYKNSEVYITPSKVEVLKLVSAPCEIIAMDATLRRRPNNESLEELLEIVHQNKKLAMADISNIEEALNAQKIGFDLVSTTLSGYTEYSTRTKGPDYKLIKLCVKKLSIPVIAEGKIKTPNELKKVLKCKPFSVVIGSSITRPQIITKEFVDVFNKN